MPHSPEPISKRISAQPGTAIVIEGLLTRLRLSVRNLADRTTISETSIRKWLSGGNITETSRRTICREFGFASWGQLERFVVPAGEVFALRRYAQDLEYLWRHYIDAGASPIFETKIALSLGFGFPKEANVKLRKAISAGKITLHRIEQPREVQRLAALAANALYFDGSRDYVLRIVPPIEEGALFTYPNFIRFGKKALVFGRTHKIGAPGANDPLVLMTGEAAETMGDHLETSMWFDNNAMPLSTFDEQRRLEDCRGWAMQIAGDGGPDAFDRHYRELTASTKAMEAIRV